MKKYLFIVLLSGLVFGQSEEKDSTFIFFKSGDLVRVNKVSGNVGYQNMINFKVEFYGSDSIEYDISEVYKIVDSQGRTLISRNKLFIIQFFRGCINLFINSYLLYLIIV